MGEVSIFPYFSSLTFPDFHQAMEKLGHAARHRGQHILAKSSRNRGRDPVLVGPWKMMFSRGIHCFSHQIPWI